MAPILENRDTTPGHDQVVEVQTGLAPCGSLHHKIWKQEHHCNMTGETRRQGACHISVHSQLHCMENYPQAAYLLNTMVWWWPWQRLIFQPPTSISNPHSTSLSHNYWVVISLAFQRPTSFFIHTNTLNSVAMLSTPYHVKSTLLEHQVTWSRLILSKSPPLPSIVFKPWHASYFSEK